MNNTTYKNHSKILKILETNISMKLLCEDEPTAIAYFKLIKEKNLNTITKIIDYFFNEFFILIKDGRSHYNQESVLPEIINFIEECFPNGHQFYDINIINGKKCIGGWNNVAKLDRALSRYDTNPTLKMEPIFESQGSDYATAIEIETCYTYVIPVLQLQKCNKNTFYIFHEEYNNIRYTKTNRYYDERSYGTAWM